MTKTKIIKNVLIWAIPTIGSAVLFGVATDSGTLIFRLLVGAGVGAAVVMSFVGWRWLKAKLGGATAMAALALIWAGLIAIAYFFNGTCSYVGNEAVACSASEITANASGTALIVVLIGAVVMSVKLAIRLSAKLGKTVIKHTKRSVFTDRSGSLNKSQS